MRRIRLLFLALSAALLIMGFGWGSAEAQKSTGPSQDELEDMSRSMGMDPAKCNALQQQIDQIVAVYQSSMSDEEKVARLTELWSQSMAAMQKSGENDPDVAAAARQYRVMMEELVAMAKGSSGEGGKAVPANARESLKKLKTLTQNYVRMMKILCPKLSLPAIMNE